MSYEKLKALIDTGQVEILLMLSTTRTRSTALQLMLTQTAHGQISSPCANDPDISFRHDNTSLVLDSNIRNFDSACDKIIKHVKDLQTKHPEDKKISLIINEYFLRLLDDERDKLVALTKNIVIPFRHANSQIASYLVQCFHQKLSKEGTRHLKSPDILRVLSILERGKIESEEEGLLLQNTIDIDKIACILKKEKFAISVNDQFDAYNIFIHETREELEIEWENFKFGVEKIISENRASISPKKIALIHTDLLIENQEKMIYQLISRLDGVAFTNEMLEGWKVSIGEDYRTGHNPSSQSNAWSTLAKKSSRLSAKNDSVTKKHTIDEFPNQLRNILVKANIIYRNCFKLKELVTVEEVKSINTYVKLETLLPHSRTTTAGKDLLFTTKDQSQVHSFLSNKKKETKSSEPTTPKRRKP